MAVNKLDVELVEADILSVGGGPAGLCAAIRASELGANVVLADKANSLRSGDAATGNDHFACYIPDTSNIDMQTAIQRVKETGFYQCTLPRTDDWVRTFLENSFDMVKSWESWGIPMKYNGKYEFVGHSYPGRPGTLMHFQGHDAKRMLTKQARKVGVKIMNRVMIFDLLSDNGTVFGAIGVSTREPKLIIFKTKSVILATGKTVRLFRPATPAWLFNTNLSPVNTGDGRMMAYRAGCELADLELSDIWCGPKYFARNGKGSWLGVFKDPSGKPVGPFVTQPDMHSGDMVSSLWRTLYADYTESGRGPIYVDHSGMTDEQYEYMKLWLRHEGNGAALNHLEEEGIDLRKHPMEFMTYGMKHRGGVYYNEKGELPVKGLFAAGDEYEGWAAIAAAAVFGKISGETATKHAEQSQFQSTEKVQNKINARKDLLEDILNREDGASWQEANIALQQVMHDYCGPYRYENLLLAGLNHLKRLRDKVTSTIKANNQHELMRCLEVLNLLDLGELVFITANERKETRDYHHRVDFPYLNRGLNDKLLFIKNVKGKHMTEWRPLA